MAAASLLISILAVVISLISSYAAWRTVRPQPRLKGKITSIWRIGATFPGGRRGAGFLAHIMLTNASTHPVHLLGYWMEIRVAEKWRKATRISHYSAFTLPELTLSGSYTVRIKPGDLLGWPPKPVHHGAPLMGFLLFLVEDLTDDEAVQDYRLTLQDVFDNRERLELQESRNRSYQESAWDKTGDSYNIVELFQHAGIEIHQTTGEPSGSVARGDGMQ